MFHFLSISNLNTSKGTFVLLDAAEILLKQTSDFHVHFVGASTADISEDRMQLEIESRGLQQVVTYHGRQYGEEPRQLRRLSMPTLVIAGERDLIRESHTRLIHRMIPNSRLSIIPGDHGIAALNPDAFNSEVLDFLLN